MSLIPRISFIFVIKLWPLNELHTELVVALDLVNLIIELRIYSCWMLLITLWTLPFKAISKIFKEGGNTWFAPLCSSHIFLQSSSYKRCTVGPTLYYGVPTYDINVNYYHPYTLQYETDRFGITKLTTYI